MHTSAASNLREVPALRDHQRHRAASHGFVPNAFIRIDSDARIALTMLHVEMGLGTSRSSFSNVPNPIRPVRDYAGSVNAPCASGGVSGSGVSKQGCNAA
jgi:hypothetical protein